MKHFLRRSFHSFAYEDRVFYKTVISVWLGRSICRQLTLERLYFYYYIRIKI